jgi:hypothetical protein
MSVILIPVHPLKCIISRTVRGAPVIHMVKQFFIFQEQSVMRCEGHATNGHVYSRLINVLEHIINPVRQWMNIARRSSSASKSKASSHEAWF